MTQTSEHWIPVLTRRFRREPTVGGKEIARVPAARLPARNQLSRRARTRTHTLTENLIEELGLSLCLSSGEIAVTTEFHRCNDAGCISMTCNPGSTPQDNNSVSRRKCRRYYNAPTMAKCAGIIMPRRWRERANSDGRPGTGGAR